MKKISTPDWIAVYVIGAMMVATLGAITFMPPHVHAATVVQPARLKSTHWQFRLCGRFASDGHIVAGPC